MLTAALTGLVLSVACYAYALFAAPADARIHTLPARQLVAAGLFFVTFAVLLLIVFAAGVAARLGLDWLAPSYPSVPRTFRLTAGVFFAALGLQSLAHAAYVRFATTRPRT